MKRVPLARLTLLALVLTLARMPGSDPAVHAAPGSGRFSVAQETVSDTVTGLVWQRGSAPTTYTFGGAAAYCAELNLAGSSDWRVPTALELASIVDEQLDRPAVDLCVFPGTVVADYWTSTVAPSAPTVGFALYMGSGTLQTIAQSTPGRVRCVR